MGSLFIVSFGIAGMLIGWFVYSRFVATRIYRLDRAFKSGRHAASEASVKQQ